MHFKYRCYGLNIFSKIALPCLQEANFEKPDITISLGSVPENLENAEKIGLGLQVNSQSILLTVHGIARYCLQMGNSIIIDSEKNSDDDSIKNFLISAALPYLLVQRGMAVLRGAAFTIDNKGAHLILGHSGSGKSTILAALCQKSAKILSDQFAVITKNNEGILCVESGFPWIKLWRDATKRLSLDGTQLVKVRPNIERYYWPLPDFFYNYTLPIQSIYILNEQNLAPKGLLNTLKGVEKIEALETQQFAQPLLIKLATQIQQAKVLFELSSQCRLTDITRISVKTSVKESVATILNTQTLP